MAYTFYRKNNAAHIVSDDGGMWSATTGASVRYNPHGESFKIDFNTESLTIAAGDITSIDGVSQWADHTALLEALTAVFV